MQIQRKLPPKVGIQNVEFSGMFIYGIHLTVPTKTEWWSDRSCLG